MDLQLNGRGTLGERARTLVVTLAVVFGSVLAGGTALADQGTIRLNNGGVISGEIVVYVPGVRVSIRAADGQVYTFEAAEVASVDVQGAAPPAQAAQPQPPPGGVPIIEDDQQPQQASVPPPAPQAQPAPGVQPMQPGPQPAYGPSYTPQPGAMTMGARAQLEAERQQLVQSMPNIGQQVVGMVLAGVVTIVGAAFWAIASHDFDGSISSPFFGDGCNPDFSSDCHFSTGQIIGLVYLVLGPILVVINALVILGKSRRRGQIKRRIQEIDQQLAGMQTIGRVRWDVMAGPNRAGLVLRSTF